MGEGLVGAGTNAGLAGAVLQGRLRARSRDGRALPFAPSAFDAELLSAVDAAVASCVPIALVIPLPGSMVPMVLGAATLVGAVLRRGALRVEVAVISSNLVARTLYDRLSFDGQRLADFVPRTTVGFDGKARVTGKASRDQGGRLHLASRLSRLDGWRGHLEGIVIDAPATNGSEVERVLGQAADRTPVVYLTGNPWDPALKAIREANGTVWAWDAGAVGELASPEVLRSADAGPVAADPALLRTAADSTVTVYSPVQDTMSDLDEALGLLWWSLGRLSGAYRARTGMGCGTADATRWVWGVHNVLTSILMSPERYDQEVGANPYALRLAQAPDTARAFARSTAGEARRSWFDVADALEMALSAARHEDKLALAVQWVLESADSRSFGLLVAPNRVAALAVTTALEESPLTPHGWRDWVQVASIKELLSGRLSVRDIGGICLPGPVPRSRSGLLGLPPVDVRVLTAGPFEAGRAARQAVLAGEALSALREETEHESAVTLGIRARPHTKDREDRVRMVADTIYAGRSPVAQIAADDDNPWEPFDADILAMLQRATEVSATAQHEIPASPPARVTGLAATTTVLVVAVHLNDHLMLLVEPNELLTRRRGERVSRVAAKSVQIGDVIALVDHAARRDLLTAVIEKLSESPTYAPLADLVAFWRSRAARLRHGDLSYGEVLHRMPGTSITSPATIGAWVRGDHDGPLDPADVGRFAIATGDHDLQAEAERVGWALRTLHGVHRKLGRWLSAQIRGAQVRTDDVLIDADLGVYVSDLLESVSTHVVTYVDHGPLTAPAGALGLLLGAVETQDFLSRGDQLR